MVEKVELKGVLLRQHYHEVCDREMVGTQGALVLNTLNEAQYKWTP